MDADPKTDSEGARLPLETGPDSSIPQRSFFRAPFCTDLSGLDAQVALLGVPYDLGTPTIGLRLGPGAIRDATGVYSYDRSGVDGKVPGGYYDIDADRQRLAGVTMADCGDVAIVPGDVERNLWRITRTVRTIAAPGSLLVSIGGEQSINVPILRGLDHHPSIDFVHFDAHLDYYDHVQGIRELSAGTIRRVATLPHVRSITQIGIHHGGPRRESFDASRARGNRVITVDRFREIGAAAAVDQVPESDALYISFDMDVMDPAGCPGSGSPEPGGLTYWEMRAALRALARRGRVVGMDLVDLAPPLDHPTGITARTGARLIIDLLTAVFD